MSEIKSVRIRKLTTGSNTGNLDLKVIISSGTASNTQRFVKAVVPTTGQTYWSQIEFIGPRYDSKTNDEIIEEFVNSNSAREITRLGLAPSTKLYTILQNPWEDSIPFLRNFGEDPYYLNNGSSIKVNWQKPLIISYSFNPFYVYALGTQSPATSIVVETIVNLDGKSPSELELDYPNKFNLFYNPGSFSLTSSVSDAVIQSQTNGFGQFISNRNYSLDIDGEQLLNDESISSIENSIYFPKVGPSDVVVPVSGYQYSDVNLNEINTPLDIYKTVTIIPRRIKPDGQGDESEKRREWTFDSDLKPDYVLNHEDNLAYTVDDRVRFNSDVKDLTIVQKTIDTWIRELSLVYPSAKNYGLKLNNPPYEKPTENLIADYSPINGWGMSGESDIFPDGIDFKFQVVGTNSNTIVPLITSTVSDSTVASGSTPSQIEKLKMQIKFPENWTVKADEKADPFSIWIGDIEADIPPEGFEYSDEVEDMSLLAPEYLEDRFQGEDEQAIFETQEYESEEVAEQTIKQAEVINNAPPEQAYSGYVQGKHKLDMIPGEFITNSKSKIKCCQIDGKPVSVSIAPAVLDLIDAAKKDGVSIKVNSGFRPAFNPSVKTKSESGVSVTAQSQEELYAIFLRDRSPDTAKPGNSKHGSGIAIDFNTGGRNKFSPLNEKNYKWMIKNSWKFGFVRTVKSEEWHFEYWPDAAKSKGPYGKLDKSNPKFYTDLGLNNLQAPNYS